MPLACPLTDHPTRRPQSREAGRVLWKALGALAVLIVVAGIALSPMTGSADSDDGGSVGDQWYTARLIDFDLTVTASGELDASQKLEVRSRVGGRPLIDWVIAEGTSVEQGQKLMELNREQVETWIQESSLSYNNAQADKVSAERDLLIEQDNAKSTQKEAELKLTVAKLDLAQWREGTVPQKRRELELAHKKAERNLERTQRDYEASVELFQEQFISRNELEENEIKLIEAEEALATAELNIRVYNEYTYSKDFQKFTSGVEQAEAELNRTISRNESKIARIRANLDSKTEVLGLRKARLEDLHKQYEACTITAPASGLVIYATSVGPRWRRNNPITPGREVRENETVIMLPDTSQMMAVLRVHEARVGKVNPDMKASVTIDAKPDHPAAGAVVDISKTAESGNWRNRHLREYKVRVALPPNFDPDLKPGMTCTARIVIGRVENELAVPVQAVFAEGADRFVYVPAGGGTVRKTPVELGDANETYVVITAGLESGDRVLLRSPRPNELRGEDQPQEESSEDSASA